jgi:acetyl-CoA synthetase
MTFPVPESIAATALIDAAKYEEMYARSVSDPDGFWGDEAKRLDWVKPFTKVKNTSFEYPNISIKWFEDGELNVAANCIDRHLSTRADQTAFIFEPDDPAETAQHITYAQVRPTPCSLQRVSGRCIRWCLAASRRKPCAVV